MRSYLKAKQNKHFKIHGVEVFIKNPVNNKINVKAAISKALKLIPRHLLGNMDVIYIGQFEQLHDRKLSAFYKDSSIFMTNEQESQEDIIDDIVHEIAHSVEEMIPDVIYADGKLEREFISKREKLWSALKDEGFEQNLSYFLDPKYNRNFDEYLYLTVGYPILSTISTNLFYSPYGATSLREYFANGFEAFFLKQETERLKMTSPILYKKIVSLLNLDQNKKEQNDRI